VPRSLPDLHGLWWRGLLECPDQPPDTTTAVAWLQGPRFFIDLRQPRPPPDFTGIAALRDLGPAHCGWLARQEGFAGTLALGNHVAEWTRLIDYQPPAPRPDRGELVLTGEVLDEFGTEAVYYERWLRAEPPSPPCWGARLSETGSGRAGFLVRSGPFFMYARDRAVSLAGHASLAEAVAGAPDLAAAQALLDCELSLGRVGADGTWRIERSSLPFRPGADLAPRLAAGRLLVDETAPEGGTLLRDWTVAEIDSASALDGLLVV